MKNPRKLSFAVLIAAVIMGASIPSARGQGALLFYNGEGEAADGVITPSGFVTQHDYPPGSFGTQWDSIVGDPFGNFLFYNGYNGEAADGQITDGGFVTNHCYRPGSFGAWDLVAGPQTGSP